MANIFTNMLNSAGDWFAAKLAPYIQDPMGRGYSILSDYYIGDQRPQLKRKEGAPDDNVYQNYVGLAVDRSVSRLLQGGVEFVLPENATAQQEYIDNIWDLNKKEITLYQTGLYGAVHGTWYFKINPDDITDPYTGKLYPRLTPINPRIIRIKTAAQDMNAVEEYKIEYTCKEERNGRVVEVTHKEITKRVQSAEYSETAITTWVIETYEKVGDMVMVLLDTQPWDYDFPPIIHCKNLPSLESAYGDSEIDDIINVQDKSNFAVSNTGKIIKFHAHPQTVGTGFSVGQMESMDTAVGVFRSIQNADAKVFNLEMQSDLSSSRDFYLDLRKSIFDIAREVDMSMFADKLGALTNFGLRVLYTDAINKNDTKRQLYGDALLELNRRLLVLNGQEGEESRPGTVSWGDAMPINVAEEIAADKIALEMGIVDKETVAQRYEIRYGVDWETIKERLDADAAEKRNNNPLLSGGIMPPFNKGASTPESVGNNASMSDMQQQRQARNS